MVLMSVDRIHDFRQGRSGGEGIGSNTNKIVFKWLEDWYSARTRQASTIKNLVFIKVRDRGEPESS